MKILLLLLLAAPQARSYPVSADDNGQISVQTIRADNLCINSGSSICGAIKGGLSGNIGIGNTNPTTKLHMSNGVLTVDGTGAAITTTGSLTSTGNLTAAGIIWPPPLVSTTTAQATTYATNQWLQIQENVGGVAVSNAFNLGIATAAAPGSCVYISVSTSVAAKAGNSCSN